MKVKLTIWKTTGFDQSIVYVSEVMAMLRSMKKLSIPIKFMVEPFDDEEEQNNG